VEIIHRYICYHDVLKYILKHHDNIYTCVITAYATKNDVQKYLNMGFNDVLLKPFEYIKLKQIFNNYNNFKQVNT
jgi:response regulator of citrate/malate metabolism